jgi:hypothetical protein
MFKMTIILRTTFVIAVLAAAAVMAIEEDSIRLYAVRKGQRLLDMEKERVLSPNKDSKGRSGVNKAESIVCLHLLYMDLTHHTNLAFLFVSKIPK